MYDDQSQIIDMIIRNQQFANLMQEQNRRTEEMTRYNNAMRQRQQPQNGMPNVNPSMVRNFIGGGEAPAAGGESAGGMGGAGVAGIIAAAILAQHAMSNQTDTVFEGQKTDDAFAGNIGTEPWLAFINDKAGWEPTIGEKFDASVKNNDIESSLKRLPGAQNYWANPIDYFGYNVAQNEFGDIGGFLASPVNWIFGKIGE